ncbi:DNA polymerase I [bacterium]|nr:DNA polymerase I [bacterium]NIN93290.1 DNA polymerase I [bacterium]NIO19085.1 DNA polymerase I [bacterium]NIO74216.1 DNA polymerase I [bacterium]
MAKEKLYLIDGNAYIHRAFHALPPLTNSSGRMVNAVYGFTRMLLKILRQEKPDYLAVCFDFPAPTFRHKEFAEYKATRKETPDELKEQIPLAHRIVKALNIPVFEKQGYEADDLISTLTGKASNEGIETVIVTGDKDALQLVDDSVRVLNEPKDILYTEKIVEEKMGVPPQQITDLMGLMGDASDNVPGVLGIGPKTGTELIREFGSLEKLYQNLSKVKDKLREKLEKGREKAFLSKRLVTLAKDVPVEVDVRKCEVGEFNREELLKLLQELEFKTLIMELISQEEKHKVNYKGIFNQKEFETLLEELKKARVFSLDLETTSPDPMRAVIVGVSFALEPYAACYIPVAHSYLGAPEQLEKKYILEKLRPILENGGIKKYGQNIKYDLIVLKREGIDLEGIYFDSMIASYVLNPSKMNHSLSDIALEYLNYKMTPTSELIGKGKKAITMDMVEVERVIPYACADADIVLRVAQIMEKELKDKGLDKLFYGVEMPLLEVLAEMEMNGVIVDMDYLAQLSRDFSERLKDVEKEIYKFAGQEFNINSPKQLSFILFDKLKLPVVSRTKTGLSTSEEVLLQLVEKHKLPYLIIEYRELQKLKSTYIDAFPGMVNPQTGRLHTSFNQTVTATGRLSSSEPNLQNIPIRTEDGRKIRRAFIPGKGYIFISTDYSQIDLRVLAHISGDTSLRDAFLHNEDIHRRTASEIFGVSQKEVTPDLRRIAKSVNFGLSYGMSPYGLSKDLEISQAEAKRYIDNYFKKYKGVKDYIKKIVIQARKDGFVTTLLNRRRYLPEINNKNANVRGFAERTAINTPIQGTSADIIKVAMIRITEKIKAKGLKAKMSLQIHDELLFEVPEGEVDELSRLAKEEMEGAVSLDVPVVVDVKKGKNWRDLQEMKG